MSLYRTKRRWQEGTYMRVATDRFRTFVYTKEDLDAYKNGQPIDTRKISQRSLSRRAQVSQTMISMLAAGKRTSCKPSTAERIAEVLGVDVTILFDPESTTINHRIAS